MCANRKDAAFFASAKGNIMSVCDFYLQKCINDRSDANFNHGIFDSLTISLKISRDLNETSVTRGVET